MKLQPHQRSLLVIIAGFGLLYLLWRSWWLLIPLPLAVAGLLMPGLGALLHRGWMQLAHLLGYINSRIILTVLFFLVLTPVACLSRLFRRKNHPQAAGTNFITRNHLFTKADLEHPW